MIFPCHSSCTVVSSDFPPLGGNVQLTAVRAAAESVPESENRGLSDESFYDYMNIGLVLGFWGLFFVFIFLCQGLSEACKED